VERTPHPYGDVTHGTRTRNLTVAAAVASPRTGEGGVDLRIVSLADRPELADAMDDFGDSWPEFMLHDQVALLMDHLPRWCPDLQFVAFDGDELVGKAQAVPVPWSRPIDELPAGGWDEILLRGDHGHRVGAEATLVSALEITLRTAWRGRGGSSQLLGAMRQAVRARGLHDLVAPVRPSAKHLEPHTPMAEYAARTRDDGLPADPWLRVHARAGARIVKVAPCAMTIAADLRTWRRWTGLDLDRSGPVEVPGALAPVHVDVEQDHAVYVEPNVWMHHPL
jgi:GNAT superfamily N-acetyltransferase